METIVKTILDKMSSVTKPQKTFIFTLLSTLMRFQGKATFRNLSRYCTKGEKYFSRWYRKPFDFINLNSLLLSLLLPQGGELIAAIDATFMEKNGKHTEGLGQFYNGKTSSAEKGLESGLTHQKSVV